MTRLILATLLAVAPAVAAIDGVVVNGTTGQPQPNVVIMLVQPTQGGMQNLGTTKSDAQGKFSFANETQGPRLMRAIYQGVLYNKMIPPGTPSTGVQLPVYDSSNKPGTAKIVQHFIVVQPAASETTVSEGILYQGGSNVTYNDPVNGIRFYLPPEANGKVSVTVNPAGGLPIQRPAVKTKEKDIYKIDYAVEPGETRFDLNYTIPTTNPLVFSSKTIQPEVSTNFVVPAGVTVKSDDMELAGTEPRTQASIYRIKNTAFKAELEGTGSLTEAGGGGGGASGEDTGQPNIQEVKPRIYDNLYWILGMSFAILALGSYLLYRNTAK